MESTVAKKPSHSPQCVLYYDPMRIALIIWFCLGALGLGLVTLEASRRKMNVSGVWYVSAVLLGPIFLFFVLPLWLGRWGRTALQDRNSKE